MKPSRSGQKAPVRVLDRVVEAQGVAWTLREWEEYTGVRASTALDRMSRGWSPAQALELEPAPKAPALIEAFGEARSLKDWAKEVGIQDGTIRRRIASGCSIEEALTAPIANTNRPADLRYQVPDGAPGSWTHYGEVPRDDGKGAEEFRYEHDIWTQDFVSKHPDGADIEEICAFTGIEASQCRAVLKSAVTKILALADDDPDVLEDLGLLQGAGMEPGAFRGEARRWIRRAMTEHNITGDELVKAQQDLGLHWDIVKEPPKRKKASRKAQAASLRKADSFFPPHEALNENACPFAEEEAA